MNEQQPLSKPQPRDREPNEFDLPQWSTEPYAIHEFEIIECPPLYDFDALGRVARLSAGIKRHGPSFAAFARWYDEEDETSSETYLAHYAGHWASLSDYAESLLADTELESVLDEAVPEHYRSYVKVDAHAYGRDLRLNGDIHTVEAKEGGIYVFRPNI